MKRRFLALALAGVMCVTLLTACGGGDTQPSGSPESTPPAT